jgi:WD40 repeat protein
VKTRTLTRTGGVSSLVFTEGGQTLVSGSSDPNEDPVSGFQDSRGCIRFWNVSDGAVLQTYDAQTGTSANSINVSANGQRFAYTHDAQVIVGNFPSLSCPMAVSPTNGAMMSLAWGASEDVPQPGDFDGDGRTDIAVWRPANGTWYVVKSSDGNMIELHWGNNGDLPVASRYLIQ